MRVVLDVNIIVSALISPLGSPAQIIDLWEQNLFDLVVTRDILEELERVLHYPKIQKHYHLSETQIAKLLHHLKRQATFVSPTQTLSLINDDLSDNRYLEAAVTSQADYLISGDIHLLKLKRHGQTEILLPAGFLALLRLDQKLRK
jgi:putative PIN family toxin of toxin-antitoxin system